MKAQIRHVDNQGVLYDAIAFICPGCLEMHGSGLHMLPVNTTGTSPAWVWDGNIEAPTISPSILSKNGGVCHSFLRGGIFEFLSDCTHTMVGQHIPMLDLPEWFIKETGET